MEQLVVKTEPIDDSEGDISMNYVIPSTSADQEMPSTSGVEVKQEIVYVKEEFKTSTDEEDEMKFSGQGSDSEVVNKEILEKQAGECLRGKDEFSCDICPKKYRLKNSLYQHKKFVHRKDILEKFQCDNCDYETLCKSSFNLHLKSHDKQNYLKCNFCEYMALQLHTLNSHILSKHRLENKTKITSKIHTCEKCGYETVKKASYNNHIKVCLKIKNVEWFTCEICHYRTILKGNLKSHLKIHNVMKELKCLFCNHHCSRKISLDNHILSKHSNLLNESHKNLITSKIHCCQVCNYKTTITIHLKQHLNSGH